MIRQSRECVINLPTTKLTDIVVGIGNTTGAEIDKFEHFGLTAEKAERVGAPLIAECHASFECRLHDDGLTPEWLQGGIAGEYRAARLGAAGGDIGPQRSQRRPVAFDERGPGGAA